MYHFFFVKYHKETANWYCIKASGTVGNCCWVLYDEWGKLRCQTITSQSPDLGEFNRSTEREIQENGAVNLLLIFKFQFLLPLHFAEGGLFIR